MEVRKRVTYTGRVQGVGFRYTAVEIASHYAVTGYVRNLPSGAVDLAAEGEADQVAGFLQALGQRMGQYILNTEAHDEPLQGGTDFRIRY